MKAQVWIETVLYTLIGLALIGTILGFALPKIESAQDKIIIKQSISSLNTLDSLISSITDQGAGNQRIYQLNFKKGKFIINGTGDSFAFYLNGLREYYSEPNASIFDGNVEVLSYDARDGKAIALKISYSKINVTYGGEKIEKEFGPAPIPYSFSLKHDGILWEKAILNVQEVA